MAAAAARARDGRSAMMALLLRSAPLQRKVLGARATREQRRALDDVMAVVVVAPVELPGFISMLRNEDHV